MTKEEKQKAIDALKISAPVMAMTQEEFNNYIQTINQIMDWLEHVNKNNWIPVSSGKLPEIHQDVLLSLRNLDVEVGFRGETEPYYYCHGYYVAPKDVLAWQPKPEPYDPEGDE